MAKAKSFRELVQVRVKGDKKFAEALLREGIDGMLSGDADTGKTILRDYIKATVGFENSAKRPARRRRVSSACSGRAAIRKPGISSA